MQHLINTLGMTESKAEEEVIVCITVPGQATAKRLGFMKISQLRLRAEALLGKGNQNYF